MLRQRQPRVRDEKHLRLIRLLPCTICFAEHRSEAAHIRYGEPARGKPPTGAREKPDDKWALPLCNEHHIAQHRTNERLWWESYGVDPIELCEELHACKTQEAMETKLFELRIGRRLWMR